MSESLQRTFTVLVIAAVVFFAVGVRVHSASMLGSFRAFYCAGRVANDGGNIFEAKPLGECEHGLQPAALFSGLTVPVLPSPLPGYLLGLFQLFARFPFWLAALVWSMLMVAALACAIAVFSQLNIASRLAFAVASAMAIFGVSILDGEPIPIALLGIALVALGVTREKAWAVAVGFLLTMTQPQIGAVLGLAVVVMQPRWLSAIAFSALGLITLSIAITGVAQNVAYLTTYLPLHIGSEVHVTLQYSPTWMAGALGFPDGSAVAVGRVSYLVAALVALFAAWRTPNENRALLVCAVPAIALCGSSYLHLDHIGLAVPAALAMTSGNYEESSAAKALLACLAAPLLFALGDPWLMLLVPVVVALLIAMQGGSRRLVVWSGGAAAAIVAVATIVTAAFGLGEHALPPLPVHTPELASESWNNYVRAHVNATSWTVWLVKLPTWMGLYGTAFLCCRQLYLRTSAAHATLFAVDRIRA